MSSTASDNPLVSEPPSSVGARPLPLIVCLCLLYVVVGTAVLLGMHWTANHLVYVLDDPYIHLSIARNLATHGIWGINDGEFAGASSSPLWTLLLAGGIRVVGAVDWLPLALNLAAVAGAMIACERLLRRFFAPWPAAVLALLACLATGLPMLVAGGMEHTLQIALMSWFIAALLNSFPLGKSEKGCSAKVWLLAIVTAMLVATRFEGLFIVFAVCIWSIWNRKIGVAAFLAAAAFAPALLYAAFSLHHGGPWLPNSVLLKGNAPPHDIVALAGYLTHGIRAILRAPPLATIALADLILLFCLRRDPRLAASEARMLLFVFLLAAFVHAQLALVGWFSRYEAYVIALGCVAGCAAASLLHNNSLTRVLWVCIALLSIGPLLRGAVMLIRIPIAAQNIYQQQFQTARFIRACGQPAAVNDIGAVSWLGRQYVVDLWGLANRQVFEARRKGQYGPAIMERECQHHPAAMAIVFDDWFIQFGGLPKSWRKLGTWTIPHNVASGGATVAIYAINPAEADELRQKLEVFSRTDLPSAVRFDPVR